MKESLRAEIIKIAKKLKIYPSPSVAFITDTKMNGDFLIKKLTHRDWAFLSYLPVLSEDFMEYFKDHLNWWHISKCQPLSESFVRKHKNRIIWINLAQNLKIKCPYNSDYYKYILANTRPKKLKEKNKTFAVSQALLNNKNNI